ncbi:uncharacterized protein [Musca autumnalis]|uniref:uncharacterized protein n=1 Tax=Musca autumnalis TaxID=221902 RepID=UPI003CF5178D
MSLNQFIRLADRLVEFDANLTDKQTPLSSTFIIETHQEELKTIWDEFKVVYSQCLSDIERESSEKDGEDKEEEEDSDDNVLLTVKSKFQSAYATYCRSSAQLKELLHSLSTSNSTPVSVTCQSPSIGPQHGFKLPPCEIPIFSGEYSSWPTFRDIFTAICIKNTRLSSVEKLFHLTQKTQGEPHEIVSKFPLTNENFELAWTNLGSRYENRRVLVNIQLKTLFSLPSITQENGNSIKKLHRDINNCISLLKLYKIDVESWGPIFVYICSNRLPESTLTLWEHTLSNKSEIPQWSSLDAFLTNRYRTLESVSEIRKNDSNSYNYPQNKSAKGRSETSSKHVRTFQNKVSEDTCKLCSSGVHVIRKCPSFLRMSPTQRYNEIKKNGLCLNCFSKVHTVKLCTSKFSCHKCNKRHNTLLHQEVVLPSTTNVSKNHANSKPSSNAGTSNSFHVQSTNSKIQSCFTTNSMAVLLGTALVHVTHNGMDYVARALLDSGSEGSFISEKIFKTIRLPYKDISAQISGLNNTISASVHKECSIVLTSIQNSNIKLPLSALVVPYLASDLPSRTIDPMSFTNVPDLPLADPRFYESSKIDILLGADVLPFVMLAGIKVGICGSLMAQETVFGWVLSGPAPLPSNPKKTTIISNFCEISLDKAISRFWEEVNIGPSRNSAMAQFFRNEARLLRTPEFKKEYDDVLNEYITLGHMSEVKYDDSARNYYLPHHAVVRPESTTTKVRVVFNASSASANGVSLNDVLYTGPVLQQHLIVLILNWRLYRYVFNADITKMYRQILVNQRHTSFQRILFRQSPKDHVKDYELKTVTFGVNCAPFLAIRTMLQLAKDVKNTYPLASEILQHSMYVDDILAGAHTVREAKDSKEQLIRALNSAGFSLLTASEMQVVQNRLISLIQKVCYPNDYMALSTKGSLSSKSQLLSLNPILDSEGVMRVCGRLVSSPDLSEDERRPILLPYKCQFSRLLVTFLHEYCLHGGNQLVLKLIRSKYWIPKAKNLVKTIIHRCKPCVLYKHRCQKQLMAALPPERTQFSRPFTQTGLDFAGPFDIKSYSGRNCRISKGYVCVFVCFSTKAIHLEATSDLSTPTFLAAFSRFISRRGCPLHLHSDNGTTFVGASKVLAKEFIQTSHEAIISGYAHQNLSWHFIPPGAPHMGGLWEAGVKSFKAHFKKVAKNFKHTFEEFQTLLSKIEACLNSRPLSPMSQDPSDLSALTPGHFLIGSPILVPIDPKIDSNPMSILNRWQRLKIMILTCLGGEAYHTYDDEDG